MSEFFKMSRVKWEEKLLFDMPWLKFAFLDVSLKLTKVGNK